MNIYWGRHDIDINGWIFVNHSKLSFCEDELYDAIMQGEHKISVRVDDETFEEQEVVLTKSKRWNGDELELISHATEGYNIREKITIFHAFTPFTYNFLKEWRCATWL